MSQNLADMYLSAQVEKQQEAFNAAALQGRRLQRSGAGGDAINKNNLQQLANYKPVEVGGSNPYMEMSDDFELTLVGDERSRESPYKPVDMRPCMKADVRPYKPTDVPPSPHVDQSPPDAYHQSPFNVDHQSPLDAASVKEGTYDAYISSIKPSNRRIRAYKSSSMNATRASTSTSSECVAYGDISPGSRHKPLPLASYRPMPKTTGYSLPPTGGSSLSPKTDYSLGPSPLWSRQRHAYEGSSEIDTPSFPPMPKTTGFSVSPNSDYPMAQNTVNGMAQNTGNSMTQNTVNGMAQNTGNSMTQNTGVDMAQNTGNGMAQNTGNSMTQNTGIDMAQNTGNGMAQNTVNGMAQNTSRYPGFYCGPFSNPYSPDYRPQPGDTGTGTPAARSDSYVPMSQRPPPPPRALQVPYHSTTLGKHAPSHFSAPILPNNQPYTHPPYTYTGTGIQAAGTDSYVPMSQRPSPYLPAPIHQPCLHATTRTGQVIPPPYPRTRALPVHQDSTTLGKHAPSHFSASTLPNNSPYTYPLYTYFRA